MISTANVRYIRITPRKFRQIIPLLKGRRAEEALAVLISTNKKAAVYATEAIKSAVANAKRTHQGIDTANLYISKITADGGPMMKRFRAGSMGRASMIKKRTSHITVELDSFETPVAENAEASKVKVAKKKGT